MKRYAFTMIELIFVIVIMGIMGKFGVEFLAQAYKTFIFSSINNKLQSDSGYAVEYMSKRLENRIKESVIARKTKTSVSAAPDTVPINSASGTSYNVLEWIAADVESFRGRSDALPNLPAWSGIIDLYNPASNAAVLFSPGTDTGDIDTLIKALSYRDSNISDAALYSIRADSNVMESFGWSGTLTQNGIMHPITSTANSQEFQSSNGVDFTNADISEYYKLSWTANAIEYKDNPSGESGTLTFYWDYQPWNGET